MVKKGSFRYLLLLIVLSFLPMLVVLLPTGLIQTHDGLVHLPRMAAWFEAVKDGQIPPRWAAYLNYGYGSPVLIFMYPWPYFLGTIFLFLGLGLVWSFKLVVILSFLLSVVSMFLFAKTFFRDKRKALIVTLFYQFASFRLIEILTRGALGEMWTYSFFPFVLLGQTLIFQGKKLEGLTLGGAATGLLVLSHNSISLSFFLIAVLFIFFFADNLKNIFWAFVSFFLGLSLSCFYFLPALWERKYTYGDLFMAEVYLKHFPSLEELFLPNFLNQPFGRIHHICAQIGFFHLLALLLAVFFLFWKKFEEKEKKIVLFSLLIFLTALFFMQPVSTFVWERISLLRQFQFPWRLLSVVVFASSLAGISFFKLKLLKKKRVFWFLAFLIFISNIAYFWPPEGFAQIKEEDYWYYPLSTTYFNETDTIWVASPPDKYPDKRIEVVGGKGEIRDQEVGQTLHQLTVLAETPVHVVDRTWFFPGWYLFVNDKPASIQFQDPNYRGLITFELPEGEHQVKIYFAKTKDRQIAEMISLLGFFSLVFLTSLLVFKKIQLEKTRYNT